VILAAGNEVAGVDPGLVAMADQVIQLPMLGSKGSLNVAVALSITTYWLRALERKSPLEQVIGEIGQVGKR
jgi:tRNA G18 (ribose-2'-O)-methylase SpoU